MEDVIGLEKAKQALNEIVVLPALRPEVCVPAKMPPRDCQWRLTGTSQAAETILHNTRTRTDPHLLPLYTHARTHAHTHTRARARTYTHTRTHARTHAHTHIHTYTRPPKGKVGIYSIDL